MLIYLEMASALSLLNNAITERQFSSAMSLIEFFAL